MTKGRIYTSSYPEKPPEWYWISGMHDACIVGVESFEFPFDYNKFIGEKSKYNRNLMTLRINSKGAIYDNTVKEIRIFNYKILTDDLFCSVWLLFRRKRPCRMQVLFLWSLFLSERVK